MKIRGRMVASVSWLIYGLVRISALPGHQLKLLFNCNFVLQNRYLKSNAVEEGASIAAAREMKEIIGAILERRMITMNKFVLLEGLGRRWGSRVDPDEYVCLSKSTDAQRMESYPFIIA